MMQDRRQKIILTVVAVLLMAAVIFLLAATEQGRQEEKKSIKIGVTVYKGSDTFVSTIMAAFEEIVSDFERNNDVQIDVNIVDSAENQITQNGQIERYITLGYDVLVVNLVDRTDASDIIEKAMNAGIPIIFYNREPVLGDLQKWDKLYYVGADAREGAELEAQIIIDIYNQDPSLIDLDGDGVIRYLMIEGETRHQDSMIRTEYSVKYLLDAGLVLEKLDGGIANWDRSQATALAKRFFEEYGDQIELIICNNDDMAAGVADAVEQLGLDFRNIVGIDGTPIGKQYVDEGRMLGTVVMDARDHAQTIFEFAYTLATGGTIEGIGEDKSIRLPLYIYGS